MSLRIDRNINLEKNNYRNRYTMDLFFVNFSFTNLILSTMPFICIANPSTNDVEMPQDSTALTPEHIASAEIFVQLCCKTEENGKKCVYKNDIGDTLTSKRLKVVLDHKWYTDDVSILLTIELCTYFECMNYAQVCLCVNYTKPLFFRLSMLTLEICLVVLGMIGTYVQCGGHHSC
jgi:hypothetical protein